METIIPKRQAQGQRYIAQGGYRGENAWIFREEGMRQFSGKMKVLVGRRYNMSDEGMHVAPSRTNDLEV
jgi:hypothetical protein